MLHPVPHETEKRGSIIDFRGATCGYDGTPALSDVNLTITGRRLRRSRRAQWSRQDDAASSRSSAAVDVYAGEVLVDGRHVDRKRPRGRLRAAARDDRLEFPGDRRAGRSSWAAPPRAGCPWHRKAGAR